MKKRKKIVSVSISLGVGLRDDFTRTDCAGALAEIVGVGQAGPARAEEAA